MASITRSDFLKSAALGAASLGIVSSVGLALAEDAPEGLAPFAFTPGSYVSKQSTGFAEMDPRLVKAFVDNSGEMLDWLVENSPQAVLDKISIESMNANFEYFADGNGINGYKCWQGCINYPMNAGGFGAGGADGDVSNASGGYGANNAMYRELQQGQRDLYDAHGLDINEMHTQGFGRDGSGIKMGMWAGGSMDPLMRTLISPEVVYSSDKYSVNILIRQGTYRFALWLDPNFERFCDESFMGCYSLLDQMERNKPGRYYAFFDNKQETLMSRSAPEHFCAARSDDALTATLVHWLERGPLGEETAGQAGETTWSTGTPCHFAANTWEELFSYMGLDEDEAAKCKAQIDRYNELAYAGKDEDFGRDPRILLPIDEPPFYGIIQVQERPALGTVTLNGLVIDGKQHVLDKGYNPILGLYASGNNSGGRWGNHYSTPIQGVSLGMALTLGRVLGKQLCEEE